MYISINIFIYFQPFFNKLEQWTNLTNITLYNAWDVADTIFVEVKIKII